MRYQRIALAAVLVGVVGAGGAGPAQAGLTTFCDGAAADVTVPGDLVVAAGDSCELTNVTINGGALVRQGANLLLADSVVDGNLVVQADGFATLAGSQIAGTIRLNAAFGAYVEDSELFGNVVASKAGFFYTLGSAHGHHIVSTGGETVVESARVTGNVTTTDDVLTDLDDTVVEGRLSVAGPEEGSVICASEVDDPATITASGDLVQVGAGQLVPGCDYSVFAADLTLTDNTAETQVSGNVVRGDLVCTGNQTSPAGEDNRVRGQASGQCASLAPAVTLSKTASKVAAEDRTADIVRKIALRTGAAVVAAERAGSAFS